MKNDRIARALAAKGFEAAQSAQGWKEIREVRKDA